MLTADYFDQWYADIDASPRRRQLFTEALGLPPEVEPSNTVPLSGLHEVLAALSLRAGDLLVDVACGRGGPGMWLARAASARLIGVDFAPVAVAQASSRRSLFGLSESHASFVVGDLVATGLDDGVADAVVCVDALQFASDGSRAAAELRRIARPGARVVVTGWEPVAFGDPVLSERLRSFDVGSLLRGAGLVDVQVMEKPSWRAAERVLWDSAMATPAHGDPALESLRDEAARSLPTWDRLRRVMVTATTSGTTPAR